MRATFSGPGARPRLRSTDVCLCSESALVLVRLISLLVCSLLNTSRVHCTCQTSDVRHQEPYIRPSLSLPLRNVIKELRSIRSKFFQTHFRLLRKLRSLKTEHCPQNMNVMCTWHLPDLRCRNSWFRNLTSNLTKGTSYSMEPLLTFNHQRDFIRSITEHLSLCHYALTIVVSELFKWWKILVFTATSMTMAVVCDVSMRHYNDTRRS